MRKTPAHSGAGVNLTVCNVPGQNTNNPCVCSNAQPGSGGGRSSCCRITNTRVNPSYAGAKGHSGTQVCFCTGGLLEHPEGVTGSLGLPSH